MKIALICGGPSLERGISLNSARSVLDHLASDTIEIVPFYLDQKKRPYKISTSQLYSNTPSDFDFKLKQTAKPLSEKQFIATLKKTTIAFPVMHGAYGENGGIQRFLEEHGIPFVGSSAASCTQAFDKFKANEYIREKGFTALPSVLLKIHDKGHDKIVRDFFTTNTITRAAVKPATGGSSIGVFSVGNADDALEKVRHIFGKRMDTRVVIEEFATGHEFTTILLQNCTGLPVALPPTEIEADYTKHQVFDFRRKYLPTRHVTYHCPPRFSDDVVEKIQAQAEQLFSLFGLNDYARFDGWVLPDGSVWFCDFNTISGMDQNSFLFQQGARVGMSHRGVLTYALESALRRCGIPAPEEESYIKKTRKPVPVLFGGPTSERQVSLMSGTNVWLKLRRSKHYETRPYLLDTDGTTVWKLPYHLTLNHTVEEISENCTNYPTAKQRLESYEARARLHLGFTAKKNEREFFDPEKLTLDKLIAQSDFIFNALHGGDGENGVLQEKLAVEKVHTNGPSARASRLCMDKWATAEHVRRLGIEGVAATDGTIAGTKMLLGMNRDARAKFWTGTKRTLGATSLVIKPRGDGCSTGVVHLYSADDLDVYLRFLREKESSAPAGSFAHQTNIIEMPPSIPEYLLFERFVETDALRVKNNELMHRARSGLVEITIGVVVMNGKLHAFNPSITIAEGEVLSVEEKFQGGTGVNLTPPPTIIMRASVVQKIRQRIETLAKALNITGYSRIDAFANIRTGDLQIIEVNTLPGLTPSTVLYHQALAESPPLEPRTLLELLIKNKGY